MLLGQGRMVGYIISIKRYAYAGDFNHLAKHRFLFKKANRNAAGYLE